MVKGKSTKKKSTNGMRKIKGKGDYEVSRPSSAPSGGILGKLDKVLSRLPKGTFAAGGAALGARFGGARGAEMGRKIGGGLSAISGYGDYTVKSNTLGTVSTSSDMVPTFVKNDHSVRVTHREFVKDITVPAAPATFTNTEYLINPGNATLFPWLSRLSKQYSQYKIHGMVFVYKTMTSDYASTGPLGTVVMATNYNAVDRAFTSKIEMENSEFAVSCKPSQSLIHAIECEASVSGLTTLYIRDPAYATTDTSDKRFYDYGKFQVATSGLSAGAGTGAILGEMWVSYDIEFMKPVIGGDTLISPCPSIIGMFDGTVGVVANSNLTGRLPAIEAQQNFVPTASTTYAVGLRGGDAYTIGGDTLLLGKVIDFGTGTIIFRKNGRYCITARHLASTSSTQYALASTTVTQTGAAGMTDSGTATSQLLVNRGKIAHAVYVGTDALGYDCTTTFEVVVAGIPDGTGLTNFSTLTTPNYTTTSASLLASVNRSVRITWMSVGETGQSVGYENPGFP